jgi:hypothetical protein
MRSRRLFWLGVAAPLCVAPAVLSLMDTLDSERETRRSLAATREAGRHGPPRVTVSLVPPGPSRAPGRVWLARFETDADALRLDPQDEVSLAVVEPPGRPGGRAVRVTVPPGRLAGVELAGLPRDWRPFRDLALDVFAPTAGLVLGVRVDDRVGGLASPRRFETAVPLAAGWNPVRIPVGSIGDAVDLRDVLRLVIYAAGAVEGGRAPRVFAIDAVWLDP